MNPEHMMMIKAMVLMGVLMLVATVPEHAFVSAAALVW